MKKLMLSLVIGLLLFTGNVWSDSYYVDIHKHENIQTRLPSGKLSKPSHTIRKHVTHPDYEGEPIVYLYKRLNDGIKHWRNNPATVKIPKAFSYSLFVSDYIASEMINEIIRDHATLITEFVNNPSIPDGTERELRGNASEYIIGHVIEVGYIPMLVTPQPDPVHTFNTIVYIKKNSNFGDGFVVQSAMPY